MSTTTTSDTTTIATAARREMAGFRGAILGSRTPGTRRPKIYNAMMDKRRR